MKRARVLSLTAVALLGVSGCTETAPDPTIVTVYDAYDGPPAFPNRRPKFTLPKGDVGLVSNNASDTVSVLDLDAATVLGSAPVGRDPVEIDGPHHLAADPVKGIVYVALAYPAPAAAPGPHAAHGASTRDGFVQALALDDFRPLGEVRVDANPGDVVLSDDGKRIVVSHFDLKRALDPKKTLDQRRATIAVIDPAKILPADSAAPTLIPTCVAPHGVALSRPDGKTAFVACYGEDVIAVVDVTDPAATPLRVPVGAAPGDPGSPSYGPYAAVLSPSGATVALSNTESKDVRFFDTAALTMSEVVAKTPGAPYFAAWSDDGARLFVPMQKPDAIAIVDAATGTTITSRTFDAKTCVLPHEAVFGSDPGTLYVACEGDHVAPGSVLAIDAITLETKATFVVGAYPDRVFILRGL